MPVKHSQSGIRVLTVLEKIAEYQPVGITQLARLLDADISAMQRSLATLARQGWISAGITRPARWGLTPRFHSVSQLARGGLDLRRRATSVLQTLRDQTDETATLNVLERGQLSVAEVQESRRYLRVVVPEGLVLPARGSATGRAILPYMSSERQIELLGGPLDAAERKEYAATIARGYAVSCGVVYTGFTNIAAPVFESDGRPVAAIVLLGPSDRLLPRHYATLGSSVIVAAQKLSRGEAPPVSSAKSGRAKRVKRDA